MDAIAKYLKQKCIYDRLKDRIKSNLKLVDHTKVKPANESFDAFRATQDGVLALYLVWDALETLKLNHTMYLFRNETGFDPIKIVNPQILKMMHELVRERRHCDVIVSHTMQWYTTDYTPQTDKCFQRKLLQGMHKEPGMEQFKGTHEGDGKGSKAAAIDKRNLLDGNASRVTVSIHLDDNDIVPKVIEIPRDTAAKNIQIYLKTSPLPREETKSASTNNNDSDSSISDCSTASTRTEGKKKNKNNKHTRITTREPLGNENDTQGHRKGFRRSPSPSRSSFSLKGGGGGSGRRDSCTTTTTTEPEMDTDSYSYIHNPDLHCLFMEELRKVKERNRSGCQTTQNCSNGSRPEQQPSNGENKCRKSNVINDSPPADNSHKETILTGCLVKRDSCQMPPPHSPAHNLSPPTAVIQHSQPRNHYTPIPKVPPHLVNQCKQMTNRHCQPPQRRSNCSADGNCFNEQVRQGTEDLITSAEVTRRLQGMDDCEIEMLKCDMEEQHRHPGFVDKIKNNENVAKLGRICGQLMSQRHKVCPPPPPAQQSRCCSPATVQSTTPPGSMHNVHPGICKNYNCTDMGCNGYQPDILSELE